MNSFGSLDAVISGYAYETATTAIGVLEEGKETKRWIGTEMLCTLDNFIKVVLFNERVFVTGCADLKDNAFIPRDPKYEAGDAGLALLSEANIFHSKFEMAGDEKAVEKRVTDSVAPLDLNTSPLFVIRCDFPKRKLTIFQEMVYLDLYFIEYAIEQFGAERFKPVFPGEHLYLGLRSRRVAVPRATHTMTDIPGRRLRAAIRSKMEEINQFVPQGAPMLPELPPIFVSRILRDCKTGKDFVPVLLKFRNSSAMKRLRKWMEKLRELSQSTDLAQRSKAADALKKLNQYSPDEDIGKVEFGLSLYKIIKNVFVPDPVGIIEEIAPQVAKIFLKIPFQGLSQFGGAKIDPKKFNVFLKNTFGDQFNRGEMDFISYHLQLADDLRDWEMTDATLSTKSGRIYPDAPPLGRSFMMQTTYGPNVENMEQDADELLKKAVPFQLIDELHKRGVSEEKIEELWEKDDPVKEIENFLKQLRAKP